MTEPDWTPAHAAAALQQLRTERARRAARIAEVRCPVGHFWAVLWEAPVGFLVGLVGGRPHRTHASVRHDPLIEPVDRGRSDPSYYLVTPALLRAYEAVNVLRSQAYGVSCRCGDWKVPLTYLADVAVRGRGQGVVLWDQPRPARSTGRTA